MDKRVATAYWGDDCIVNSLGFSTQENITGIEKYHTEISHWHEGTPVCLTNKERLHKELENANLINATLLSPAAQHAILALSKIKANLSADRTLLILSTTKGDVGYLSDDIEKCYLSKLAKNICDFFEATNQPLIISNACISGVSAIITGARLIEWGEYDDIYIIGVDVLNDFIISGFNAFKSVSKEICRPYDAQRNGLTLGEGCGAIRLTNKRELSESKIIVAGGGISNDANHISGPSRTGDGLYFAIQTAVKQANISANQVSFVNTHGTATVFNDEMESKALTLSGLENTPCNSLKPYFGHTLGASGVIESILCVHQLQTGIVYGVKGYQECGVPHQLNITAEHRKIATEIVIKTASGFGGCNAAVVFCKENAFCKEKTSESYKESANCTISTTAHIEITHNTELPFGEYIRQEYKMLQDPNIKFAKMDDLSKLGYIAANKLLQNRNIPYPQERIAIILANKSSSLESDIKHQKNIEKGDLSAISPAIFVYTLPNIVSGEIAIKHKIKGENTFFVFPDKTLKFAQSYAHNLIKKEIADAVIYGWCELLGENYNTELTLLEKDNGTT